MEQTVTINGVKINYRRGGSGAPMILMHGWGSENSTLALFERVGREQREVFNIDLPGFGKSEEPPVPWGIEEYTQMLEQFVKTLGIEKPVLLGHSFGGRIAILYASRNPVESVILVDAAGIKPRRSIVQKSKNCSYKIARTLLPKLLGKRGEDIVANMREKRASADYRNSSPMMRRVMVKAINTDLRYAMPYITAPTLLLWGENDTATPMRDAHIMNRLIKNSTLVSFPGAGHFSFLDNPFQSAAVVRRFILPKNPNAQTEQEPSE